MNDPSMMGSPMGGDASSMPMGGDPTMMGGDPNTMGGDPNAMGGDPNMIGGDPNAQQPLMTDQEMQQGNEGFDMGIGMTPDEDPKKWIQGAATKLASELRKYQESQPAPDMEVNKTAVNTVAAATKSNLDNGKKNELMTSYADTMRDDDNESDGAEDFSDDGQDSGDMGGDPNAMGDDPNAMGDDTTEMGGDQSVQQMMESKIHSMVSEMLSDITKNNKRNNDKSAKVKHTEQGTGYARKPYTV